MGLFRRRRPAPEAPPPAPPRRIWRRLGRGALRLLVAVVLVVAVFGVIRPPTTWTILTESRHPRTWVRLDDIAPVMTRSAVAAEDANFCLHWGFDMTEIRKVVASGGTRGASTISQQVVKNVFLWQGGGWWRKLPEAALTPILEATWSKRRILETYLNVAEFGPGVFGIHAAAAHHFKTTPDKLTVDQAARLAAILPAPKTRDPKAVPGRRVRAIADGAATIARDGRDICFKPRG